MPNPSTTTTSNSPPAKRRGRPLKEPSDHSTEVSDFPTPVSYLSFSTQGAANITKLQRARVRRAQKVFRSRKEQHVASLEEKCKTLESVVEEMTNEFLRFSDGLLGIGEGRSGGGDVDSYVKREMRGTMERFLELGRRAGRDPGEEEEEERGGGDENADDDDQEKGTNFGYIERNGSQLQDHNMLSTPSSTLLPPEPLHSQDKTVAFPTTSSHAPLQNPNLYLNNIWTLPPSSSSDTSAIPYILAGRDSFAARLYFSIISSAVHSLRGTLPPTLAQSFFRYKCRYVSPSRIQSVVDGVLNMLLHGTSQARAPTGGVSGLGPVHRAWGGEDDEVRVKRAILSEVEEMGETEDEFLATWDVEKYLKTKWRLAIDSTTVRVKPRAVVPEECLNAVSGLGDFGGNLVGSGDGDIGVIMGAPTMIPGFEHSCQRIWDAGSLVERLLDVAVTIGEGPRWHYKQIDSVVEAFLVENASRN